MYSIDRIITKVLLLFQRGIKNKNSVQPKPFVFQIITRISKFWENLLNYKGFVLCLENCRYLMHQCFVIHPKLNDGILEYGQKEKYKQIWSVPLSPYTAKDKIFIF